MSTGRRKSVVQPSGDTPRRRMSVARPDRSRGRSREVAENLTVEDPVNTEAIKRQAKIFNDEIDALQIKPENLPRKPVLSEIETVKSDSPRKLEVSVMKEIPECNRLPTMKGLSVLRQAPADAKVFLPGTMSPVIGPTFTDNGHLVPHSILGSPDEFYEMALKRGDISIENIPPEYRSPRTTTPGTSTPRSQLPSRSLQSSKTGRSSAVSRMSRSGQNEKGQSSLDNWQSWMKNRKFQISHLARCLERPEENLVMCGSDIDLWRTQRMAGLIDQSIPFYGNGKGYRVGSEFWNQVEFVDRSDISVTITEAQRGFRRPIEHLGISKHIREELGVQWKPTGTPRYPWHLPYYTEREKQVSGVIKELNPNWPECEELQVIGKPIISSTNDLEEEEYSDGIENGNKTLSSEELTYFPVDNDSQEDLSIVLNGPSLIFGGRGARWIPTVEQPPKLSNNENVEVALVFSCDVNERCRKCLEIINSGSVVLHYSWGNVPLKNSFNMIKNKKEKRFYLDSAPGVILPGQRIKVPFIFKSRCPGVYKERWQLHTTPPILPNAAAFVVNLRATALQEDLNADKREHLEAVLNNVATENMVRSILNGIISGMQKRDIPKIVNDDSPTDEDLFEELNPQLKFSHIGVHNLDDLYDKIVNHEEDVPLTEAKRQIWDKSVLSIKEEIAQYSEEQHTEREEIFGEINSLVDQVSFAQYAGKQSRSAFMYQICYTCLIECADLIFMDLETIRRQLQLPDLYKMDEEPKKIEPAIPEPVEDFLMVPSKGRLGRRPSKGRTGPSGAPKSADAHRRTESKSPQHKTPPSTPMTVQIDLADIVTPELVSSLTKEEQKENWKLFRLKAFDLAYARLGNSCSNIVWLFEGVPNN